MFHVASRKAGGLQGSPAFFVLAYLPSTLQSMNQAESTQWRRQNVASHNLIVWELPSLKRTVADQYDMKVLSTLGDNRWHPSIRQFTPGS